MENRQVILDTLHALRRQLMIPSTSTDEHKKRVQTFLDKCDEWDRLMLRMRALDDEISRAYADVVNCPK